MDKYCNIWFITILFFYFKFKFYWLILWKYVRNNNNRIDLDEFIRFSLRDALARSSSRVIDLFRQLDDDNSGLIDGHEFKKGLKEMGLAGMPPESLGALFASFDPDGDKYIEYDELHELIVRSAMKHPDLPPLALEAKNPIAIRKKKIKKEVYIDEPWKN